MGQTYHKIILEQALNDYISIDSCEIEVDGESIDHVELIILDIIIENAF